MNENTILLLSMARLLRLLAWRLVFDRVDNYTLEDAIDNNRETCEEIERKLRGE